VNGALITPYGGSLVEPVVPDAEIARRAGNAEPLPVSHDAAINLANIGTGAYSPVAGFMTEAEYRSVVERTKLPSGLDWTIPILLHVASAPEVGETRALRDPDGKIVGAIEVASVFEIDRARHAKAVFATDSTDHPGVEALARQPAICVGGPIRLAESAVPSLRHYATPRQNRARLAATGKTTFTAFSTRNICHLGHEYLHGIALENADILGIAVITGAQVKGSFLPDVVFDTYEYLVRHHYPEGRVHLINMRLPPIYAGPKEAFLQATVLQNLGFTQFIVGRDHAGVGSYYERYGSQKIFRELTGLGIQVLPISEPRWCGVCNKITTELSCRHSGHDVRTLNGRDVRRFLLEKRYAELETILRPELQALVTSMFETEANLAGSELAIREPRRIFYE
jgi:sulfate adenylyltransferase